MTARQNKYILAIDHGTSGMKSAIISVYGEIIDFEFEKTPIHFLPDGGAEQNPEDWWRALISTSRKLVQKKGGVPKEDIVAVSVSSTFSTTVAVDEKGRPLMNAITWMDSRGAPYVRQFMSGFPSVDGYNLFKIMKWLPITGGGPTLSGKDDIAHVLLVKNEFPEVYKNTRFFLPSKDYLNQRLTDEFAASFDSIQLFWVTDIRDVTNIRYHPALIQAIGIDPTKLPPLKAATDILGPLKPSVAREIGLPDGVKVVVGSPDHQTACIGSGAVNDFQGHIYIGTSSWIQSIIPFKKTDIFHSIASFPTAIPGKYQSVNEQDLAGGCLSFLFENILYHKNNLIRERPEDPFRFLDDIARQVPAGSCKLIFTPWLNGERTPVDDPWLRGGLFNLSKTTNQDHVIRAVLEGVAYNTRWSLGHVERFIGRRMDPLHIIGGGGKSRVWCQIFADVLNREIRQVDNPRQANARGAAYIAAVALGFISFKDIPELVTVKDCFYPTPAHRKTYDELYQAFIEIYRRNRKLFRRLNLH